MVTGSGGRVLVVEGGVARYILVYGGDDRDDRGRAPVSARYDATVMVVVLFDIEVY